MTIYNYARGDLERDKFIYDSSGAVAVNVHIADTLPISLSGDVEIGAVELKDSGSENRAHIDTSGALDVNIISGDIEISGSATETTSQAILQVLTDGSFIGTTSVNNFPSSFNVNVTNSPSISNTSFDVNITNSSLAVTGNFYPATQTISGNVGFTNSSIGITNSSFAVSGTASVNVTNTVSTSDGSALSQLQTINSLIPTKYDYITCSYDTSGNLTSSIFKLGGATGSTASTLSLTYSGSNLLSVTKT